MCLANSLPLRQPAGGTTSGTTSSIHKRLPWPSLSLPPPDMPPPPAAQARRRLIPPKPLPGRRQQLPYLLPHQPGQQGCQGPPSPSTSSGKFSPWLGWEISLVGKWSRVSWLFLGGGFRVCQGERKLCLVYHQTGHLTCWSGCECFHGTVPVPTSFSSAGDLHFKKEILPPSPKGKQRSPFSSESVGVTISEQTCSSPPLSRTVPESPTGGGAAGEGRD